MAKIYVSSTFNDLEACRRHVSLVIRKMGHEDVAMEYYIAEDKRPIDKCLEDVANCDLYIGIFAWRYGWVPKKSNPKKLSITELEYRQAVEKKKTCLIFLLDDKALWPPAFIDDNKKRVRKLRDELSEEHGAGLFTSAENIGSVVAPAVHEWMKKSGLLIAGEPVAELDLEKYYEALRKRYNVLALEGLTPPQKEEYLKIQLRSVFVEQSVREDTPPVELPKEVWEKLSREQEIQAEDLPSGITLEDVRKARESYYQKPSRLVLEALADSRNKYTTILGDPGSGKSTLARYVMLSLIDPALAGDKLQIAFAGYLPLLIELRTFAGLYAKGKCETPLEFLEHLSKAEGWELTQAALHNHLKNDRRVLAIFDGLDEIFEPKLREDITRQIVGFTNQYPKARVVVTSRILGYHRKILSDAGFVHFTLQDLEEEQVETFVIKWYDMAMSERPDEAQERSERILKSFKESASIRQLAGNPMLLTIMAIIGKHQELPRERWKLYDHAASVLIQHWDVNKHLKDERIEADFIGEDDKKELLRRLAYRMQSGDGGLAGNYIHREGLREEFESYLKERYSQTPAQAKIIAQAMIQQFRERNFILSLYGANLYGFVHRAFLEYFCASAFVWKFEKTKELTIEQLKTDVYGKHWKDQSWHEVLRLVCGIVDEKWVTQIIQNLFMQDKQPRSRVDFSFDFSNWSWEVKTNFMLATECLGEVRNLNLLSDEITHLFQEDTDISAYAFAVLKTRLHELTTGYSLVFRLASGKLSESPLESDWRKSCLNYLAEHYTSNSQTLPFLQERAVQDDDASVRSAAVSALAKYYHEDAGTLPLLRERAVNDNYNSNDIPGQFRPDRISVRETALELIGEYYREDGGTLPLLQERAVRDENANVRSAAVRALVEHYREDAQTLPLLQERAVRDENAYVRSTAVRALVEHYREDAQTLPLLRECVVNDNYNPPKGQSWEKSVRETALELIGEYYREDGGTLPLLQERAVRDENADVRSTAVSALVEHYRENSGTLSLLQERAVRDENAYVRSTAVSALVEHYREDAGTLPLLQERAVLDESPKPDEEKEYPWQHYVRGTAIVALVEYWREDSDTLPLLRDRAKKDPTPWLRERARELVKEIEGEKK